MSLLGDCYQSASSGGGGGGSNPPASTVLALFTISAFETNVGVYQTGWLYRIPHGVTSVTVEGWAGGGPASQTPINQAAGPGGGGGGYFKKTFAVIADQVISGKLGNGGSAGAVNNGAATTLTSPACTANGGHPGVYGGSAGVGGTATGGDTNTTGNAGGLTNSWDGGSAGNGGGDQTTQGGAPTKPGGGGAGGFVPNTGFGQRRNPGFNQSGASGQIRISVA